MQMCFVHLPCWDREHSWLKGLVYCQRWRAPWARYFMRWFMRGNLLVVRECIWHIVNNNDRFMLLIFGFGFDERQYLHSISICMKMSLLGNNNVNWKEILSTQQIANSYKSHNNFLRGHYVLKIAIKYNLSDTFLCVFWEHVQSNNQSWMKTLPEKLKMSSCAEVSSGGGRGRNEHGGYVLIYSDPQMF